MENSESHLSVSGPNVRCPSRVELPVSEATSMSREVQTFTQGKVTKALKGADKAGKRVTSAMILPDGSIKLDFEASPLAPQDVNANEWDTVK